MSVIYKCGTSTFIRKDPKISAAKRVACFGYIDNNRCSALNEMLCRTKGKCPFWKEEPIEDESDY